MIPGLADAAGAGVMLIGVIALGAGAGLGLGSLVGSPTLLAILGGVAGLIAASKLVHSRFRDI